MNQVEAKIYYEIKTGDVLTITSECQGSVMKTTKEQDMDIYPQLKDKNIDSVDFIELEYGTLATTFSNVKSYKINLDTKSLECEYYTTEEMQGLQDQEQKNQELNSRASDISQYLLEQSSDTISAFEDFIMQNEINKTMEGMN